MIENLETQRQSLLDKLQEKLKLTSPNGLEMLLIANYKRSIKILTSQIEALSK